MNKNDYWRPVNGYIGFYEVSKNGEIRSVKRKGTNGGNLKPKANNKGYLTVKLCKGKHAKDFLVHRIVAEAFLSNPNNLPCINHIDEDKENNSVLNLEWCDYSYNNNYGTAKKRRIKAKGKPCKAVWPDGTEKIFENCAEAGREVGLSQGSIWGCCNGRWKTSGGAKWSYI